MLKSEIKYVFFLSVYLIFNLIFIIHFPPSQAPAWEGKVNVE